MGRRQLRDEGSGDVRLDEFKLVGQSFMRTYPAVLRRIQSEDQPSREDAVSVFLVRQHTNAHDPNAISVEWYEKDKGMTQIGWVPKELAAELAPIMDARHQFIELAHLVSIKRRKLRNPEYEATVVTVL
jgi:hypothetical protein